jgi:hypothetical protein
VQPTARGAARAVERATAPARQPAKSSCRVYAVCVPAQLIDNAAVSLYVAGMELKLGLSASSSTVTRRTQQVLTGGAWGVCRSGSAPAYTPPFACVPRCSAAVSIQCPPNPPRVLACASPAVPAVRETTCRCTAVLCPCRGLWAADARIRHLGQRVQEQPGFCGRSLPRGAQWTVLDQQPGRRSAPLRWRVHCHAADARPQPWQRRRGRQWPYPRGREPGAQRGVSAAVCGPLRGYVAAARCVPLLARCRVCVASGCRVLLVRCGFRLQPRTFPDAVALWHCCRSPPFPVGPVMFRAVCNINVDNNTLDGSFADSNHSLSATVSGVNVLVRG